MKRSVKTAVKTALVAVFFGVVCLFTSCDKDTFLGTEETFKAREVLKRVEEPKEPTDSTVVTPPADTTIVPEVPPTPTDSTVVIPPADTTIVTPEVPPTPEDTTVTPEPPFTPDPYVEPEDDDRLLGSQIVGAYMSAVPSRDMKADYDKRCLLIITEKGAIAVSFEKDEIVPEEGRILAGYFVEGDFNGYNSGIYIKEHDRWEPAIATTEKTSIIYKGEYKTDHVLYTTLKMWNGWKNGLTFEVEGYTIDVNQDGILKIIFNGELYMQIR